MKWTVDINGHSSAARHKKQITLSHFSLLSNPPELHFCKLMEKFVKLNGILIAILLLLLLVYYSRIAEVPFHPDESTQLAMSADVTRLFDQPLTLVWDPNQTGNIPQTYRLLDAPLTRYLLGIGRILADLPPVSGFWDWSLDWQNNLQNGAYPDSRTLLGGRLTLSLLFPFSLIFLYLSASRMGGRIGGYAAIILFGLNALVLLHTRRAMAEGPLLFGITMAMASWSGAPRRPWLAGLAMAIAFNAKQSSIFLFPVGLLAVCWFPAGYQRRPGHLAGNILQYALVFIALTYMLNPIFWRQPYSAARAAAQARTDLLSQQVADTSRLAPNQVLDKPLERIAVLLGHLYLTPPIFAEAGNYRPQTIASETIYMNGMFNSLGRNPYLAGMILILTLLGLYSSARRAIIRSSPGRRDAILAIFGTICMAAGLLLAVPLPWQRYVLPLIPFACLWAGIGLSWLLQTFGLRTCQRHPSVT